MFVLRLRAPILFSSITLACGSHGIGTKELGEDSSGGDEIDDSHDNVSTDKNDDGDVHDDKSTDRHEISSGDGDETTNENHDTNGDCKSSNDACDSLHPGMACVGAGEFEMGSDASRDNERPARTICLSTYFIDRTEVTVEAYRECVMAGKCTEPQIDDFCNWEKDERDEHPVNCVDWFQAKMFCEWEGKRLPTEAEWEKAARGIGGRQFPWGDEMPTCEHAVFQDENSGGYGCGELSTAKVGSRSPKGDSPYGVSDMAGNISEWVLDWYENQYDPDDTSNPYGPGEGTLRTMRGGDWVSDKDYLTTTFRSPSFPDDILIAYGFRCAMAK